MNITVTLLLLIISILINIFVIFLIYRSYRLYLSVKVENAMLKEMYERSLECKSDENT